jgi:hypothetical protein
MSGQVETNRANISKNRAELFLAECEVMQNKANAYLARSLIQENQALIAKKSSITQINRSTFQTKIIIKRLVLSWKNNLLFGLKQANNTAYIV